MFVRVFVGVSLQKNADTHTHTHTYREGERELETFLAVDSDMSDGVVVSWWSECSFSDRMGGVDWNVLVCRAGGEEYFTVITSWEHSMVGFYSVVGEQDCAGEER